MASISRLEWLLAQAEAGHDVVLHLSHNSANSRTKATFTVGQKHADHRCRLMCDVIKFLVGNTSGYALSDKGHTHSDLKSKCAVYWFGSENNSAPEQKKFVVQKKKNVATKKDPTDETSRPSGVSVLPGVSASAGETLGVSHCVEEEPIDPAADRLQTLVLKIYSFFRKEKKEVPIDLTDADDQGGAGPEGLQGAVPAGAGPEGLQGAGPEGAGPEGLKSTTPLDLQGLSTQVSEHGLAKLKKLAEPQKEQNAAGGVRGDGG
eukprot:TRINITY_DN7486_c0_g1_i9.p1 TRINITY_DN7486_c0_g1~~TRINITY_DN7486_c0_g1_i9.p1  ORF type:complete len:276 (-),score=46.46 TRINITY_DN7486_c0_g1_i9:421-1206(-)